MNTDISRISIATFVQLMIFTSTYLNIFHFSFSFQNQDRTAQQFTSLFITFMVILCYFKAAFTSPIQTDVDGFFKYDITNRSKGSPIINIDTNKYNKKCHFCNKIKFERSSHCRICNVCVLRRDHHCAWIGNCVGFGNNQYFLNFSVWIIVSIN